MTKPLAFYFEEKNGTAAALRKYVKVADQRDWSIPSKLSLYKHAKIAFERKANDDSREAFSEIYSTLRNYWQVFRGSPKHWNEHRIYSTLVKDCGSASRSRRLTLKSNLLEASSLSALQQHLKTLEGIKGLRRFYPAMTVSKFSHFFNPALFPIFDNAIVYREVLRKVFRDDWETFDPPISSQFKLAGKPGIWDAFYWIVWGSDMTRRSTPNLMEYFAEWFIKETRDDNNIDFLEDLKTYYATAFEFIAIGACHLNA
jgi:hypothetical protein